MRILLSFAAILIGATAAAAQTIGLPTFAVQSSGACRSLTIRTPTAQVPIGCINDADGTFRLLTSPPANDNSNRAATTAYVDRAARPVLGGGLAALTVAPYVAHLPVGNPLNTYGSVVATGTTAYPSAREFLASFGLTSNLGLDQTDVSGLGDKVTLYSGMVQAPNSGNAWAFNTVTTRQPGVTKSTIGYEIDINNNDQHLGEALGAAGLARPFGMGLIVTGAAPYRSTSAIQVDGPGAPLWNRGIMITGNSVKQASFQDLTVSDISIDVRGGHIYPIDLANSGVVQAAIRLRKGNSVVAGLADSGGARVDSGNVQVVGTDGPGNVRLAYDGSTYLIVGSTYLPKLDNTLDIGSTTGRIRNLYLGAALVISDFTPASSTSGCTAGTVTFDANYMYRCVATNTWKRTAMSSW